MIPVEDARKIILDSTPILEEETIESLEAIDRILYEKIISEINIPSFDNSAMDGYALKYNNSEGASETTPVQLKIIGEIQAGDQPDQVKLTENSAIRIMTGAPVPEGADAVIPVEDTSEIDGIIFLHKSLEKNENVRFAGEDIATGQCVLNPGDKLLPADIGLLCSLGEKTIKVYRKPDIAIISTGDEIIDISEKLEPGKIRNSNSYSLYSIIKKYGAIPHYLGISRDTYEDTKAKIEKALEYDIVITTGGVSMGKYDFVKEVISDLGISIKIEKVKMKPGKPVVFGTKGEKLFFGLPGNPVSTLISFIQFVRPTILKMMGSQKLEKPVVKAILEDKIRKKSDRMNYIRGYFSIKNGQFHVSTTGPQGSGILRSMSTANCLIIAPEKAKIIEAGSEVDIQLINHDEI